MILYSDFHTKDALKDDAVGISIQNLIHGAEQDAWATIIESGKRVGCHSHHHGEEWYIILSGTGVVFTAEVNEGELSPASGTEFRRGSVFCIAPDTAHQLVAHSRVELIFFCPPSHLTHDRTGFGDIC
jgi:mannose-6-phosphate isomerase-like protein (cupin superfamily)